MDKRLTVAVIIVLLVAGAATILATGMLGSGENTPSTEPTESNESEEGLDSAVENTTQTVANKSEAPDRTVENTTQTEANESGAPNRTIENTTRTESNGSEASGQTGTDEVLPGLEENSSRLPATRPDEFAPPAPDTEPGELSAEASDFVGFENVASDVGLDYETEPHELRLFTIKNQGVYVTDFTRNGYEDILLVGGDKPILYRNERGSYTQHRKFNQSRALTAHFLDYNSDGWEDLLIAPVGDVPVIYENVGGEFERQTGVFSSEVELNFPTTVTSADFFDDGCLDVFIGQWWNGTNPFSVSKMVEVGKKHPNVRPTTSGGARNYLLDGNCSGFTDVSDRLGKSDLDFTLASSAADLTGNSHIDLHVGNDATADYIYENKGNGSFERINLGPASDRNAMSSSVIDVSGNHRLDIFTTNIYYDNPDVERYVPILRVVALPLGNSLFINSGDTGFTDVAPEHGLHRGSWGWASTVADYTNDGHLDVIHASSYVDPPVVGNHSNIYKYPQVWKGTTDSWKKVNGSSIGFSEHNLRGVARVDYDNDGALDFVAPGVPESGLVPGLEAGQNETFLYENQREGSESLQLFVRNPDGLSRNAEVYVETDERTVYRVANARGDLLSQNSRLIHIGTANENVEQVTVEWPDGAVSSYDNVESGHRYVLTPDVAKTVG